MKFLRLISPLALLSVFFFAPPLGLAEPDATERFDFKLFKLCTRGKNDNVVVSPFSVSAALSMTANGAAGKTRDEMRATLGLQGTDEESNKRFKELTASLLKVNPVSELNIANALFAKAGFKIKPDFIAANQNYFGAKVETLDFAKPETVQIINDWVKEQTKGKIPTIVENIAPDVFLYLVNAVYFKGDWLKEFDKAASQTEDFRAPGGKQSVTMMHRSEKMRYLEGENFQAVALPYKDNRLEMRVFLPAEKTDVHAFIDSLTNENWKKWSTGFEEREGHLGLPRFKIEYKTELKDVLVQAGMPCAFADDCADFSRMVDDPAVISRVLHKTFIEVNEKGTEAAAVTAVEMRATSAMIDPVPPFEMICDRPFVIVIRDAETDTNLFVGLIASPKGE